MAGIMRYVGRVVGVNSRDYDFVDRTTGERVQGTSHRVFLLTDDESEPIVEMKAADDVATKARASNGKAVQISAEPRAKGNQVVWYALSLDGHGG